MPAEDDYSAICACSICLCILLLISCVAVLGGIMYLITLADRDPLYSAAIGSVTGLDVRDLGRRPADLNPLFNLTLRVTTRSFFSSGCTHPGAVAEVTYAGVKLATGPVPWFCAKPRRAREMAVEEWGTTVQVPRFAMDRLTGDGRRGVMVFDVAITMPSTHDNGHHGKLVSCRGMHARDSATLRTPCAVSDVDPALAVPIGKEVGIWVNAMISLEDGVEEDGGSDFYGLGVGVCWESA